jgi:hypothetical protein
MIEKFIEEGTCPKLKVLMIDESQDLTPLQWDLVLNYLIMQNVYI